MIAVLATGVAGLGTLRGGVATRLVALCLASTIAALTALVVAESFGDESAYDVAFAIALLGYPSSFVYARFFGRWL